MDEISKSSAECVEQSGSNSGNELIFYDLCYQQRLSWTKKLLPVRFEDEAGFFIEGYLTTVKKRHSLHDRIQVMLARSSPGAPSRVSVAVSDIHPSKRWFTKLDLEKEETVTTDPIDMEGEQIELPPMLPVTGQIHDKIHKFFVNYNKMSWTLDEVRAAINLNTTTPETVVYDYAQDNLEHVGKRQCLMTNTPAETYKLKRPKVGAFKEGETLDDLREAFISCQDCDLGIRRDMRDKPVVFGRGPDDAKAIIIGEAPGIQEENADIAFHPDAPAGNALYRVMNRVGLPQDEGWFMTNAVICRPEPPNGSRAHNGKPQLPHLKACSGRLKRTLDVLQPKLIVLLGAVAYKAFYGSEPLGGVTRNVGWQPDSDPPVYLALHPSYICRKENIPQTGVEVKRQYLACWREIAERFNQI